MPRSPLHDGAVIIRAETIVAAGALLPLAETSLQSERFGTRHRAALGITEQTDAVVVVVSEENAQVSLVERARIVRNLDEAQLRSRAHDAAQSGQPAAHARRPRRGRRAAVRRRPASVARLLRREPDAAPAADRYVPEEDRAGSGIGTSQSVRRALGFLLHNWPLKLAAIALATILYAGLVLSAGRAHLARAACRSRCSTSRPRRSSWASSRT